MQDEDLVFSGLKVLDVSSWIAAPVAATMLGTRGADVLKIEVPVLGDGYRNYALAPFTPNADVNYTWHLDNRNKRSMTLNLKTEQGQDIMKRLIKECDVFVINQPLPLRRLFNLMYEDIKDINERMIYASLTPYGEEGPDSDREAFDLLAYWNRSGLMDKMRPPGSEPVQALAGMGDHPTAVALYASIVTALLQRERTGKGTMVHTSLLANGVWSASCIAQAQFADADFAHLPGQRMTTALYQANDGRWLQLNMIRTAEDFDHLLVAIDAVHLLADERFSTLESRADNADDLTVILREIFATRSSDEWLQILRQDQNLPIERVATFSDLKTDPHLTLNHMVQKPLPGVGMEQVINDPVNVNGMEKRLAGPAPEMGQHTDEILKDLGFDADAIVALHEAGVV
jgi:crotonobetainyl-CoA:carnitine CoA-transferase CaiB-like acyl-CoA transferase